MEVRSATIQDYEWLKDNDHHVNSDWIKRCILQQEYLVCQIVDLQTGDLQTEYVHSEYSLAGFIRYSLFWGEIPYMDMIWVLEQYRFKGVGTALFNAWQSRMESNNAKILMTSSVMREKEPQVWHQRNGFEACGQLTFGQFDQSPEIFMVKNL